MLATIKVAFHDKDLFDDQALIDLTAEFTQAIAKHTAKQIEPDFDSLYNLYINKPNIKNIGSFIADGTYKSGITDFWSNDYYTFLYKDQGQKNAYYSKRRFSVTAKTKVEQLINKSDLNGLTAYNQLLVKLKAPYRVVQISAMTDYLKQNLFKFFKNAYNKITTKYYPYQRALVWLNAKDPTKYYFALPIAADAYNYDVNDKRATEIKLADFKNIIANSKFFSSSIQEHQIQITNIGEIDGTRYSGYNFSNTNWTDFFDHIKRIFYTNLSLSLHTDSTGKMFFTLSATKSFRENFSDKQWLVFQNLLLSKSDKAVLAHLPVLKPNSRFDRYAYTLWIDNFLDKNNFQLCLTQTYDVIPFEENHLVAFFKGTLQANKKPAVSQLILPKSANKNKLKSIMPSANNLSTLFKYLDDNSIKHQYVVADSQIAEITGHDEVERISLKKIKDDRNETK